jgi:thioesterase domain-containing protein
LDDAPDASGLGPDVIDAGVATTSLARPKNLPTTFVPLVSDGAGEPFFLLHPATPLPWCYRPLVDHATWDRPVYAARGVELDWEYDLLDLQDLVTQYLIDIRQVQPKGPYFLGGWSVGGVLAFEVACRLAMDGQKVQRLIMFDTYAPVAQVTRWRRQLPMMAVDLLRPLARSATGRAFLDRIGWTSPLAKALLLLRVDRPLSPDGLREILEASFPALAAGHAFDDASFEELCEVLVNNLRPLIPASFLHEFDRAFPSARGVDFVRYHQLRWKNHWLGVRYKARRVFPGQITMYVSARNARVAGWQRFSSAPLDIRRVKAAAYDGVDIHLSFFHPANVQLYAEDLSRLLQTT